MLHTKDDTSKLLDMEQMEIRNTENAVTAVLAVITGFTRKTSCFPSGTA